MSRSIILYSYQTSYESATYTLRGLGFERTYNVSVRARMSYRYCRYSYINGEYSDEVSVTTVESGLVF